MSDDLRPSIITGLPTGIKEAGQRVDFRIEQYDLAIQTKGYRVWWSRAAICPCRNNDQTSQAAVNCAICGGTGWFYYLPDLDLDGAIEDPFGNPIEINESGDAVGIMALMTSATLDPQIYERFGEWVFGTMKASTQAYNRLGYRDRLIVRDSEMVWGQLVKYDGSEKILVVGGRSNAGLRYTPTKTFLICSVVAGVRTDYREGSDYLLTDGEIVWLGTPPDPGTLFVSYQMHPTFRVLDHVYAFRDTLVAKKTKALTKADQHKKMPIHAMVKLDFLMDSE